MRRTLATLAAGAALTAACARELPTATAPVTLPNDASLDLGAATPVTRQSAVSILIALAPAPVTLAAIYHESPGNVWLQLLPQQPEGVTIDGPARVQFTNGRTIASGIVIIGLTGGVTLEIDLGQFDGSDTSPFIGPGGGCIAGIAIRTAQGQSEQVPVRLEFATGDAQVP